MDKWEDLWQDRNNYHLPFFSLYVSNLPLSMTARALKKLFEKYGELISANVILDPITGYSRGYGFIDYTTEKAREIARSVLHNTNIDGQCIRVSRSHGKSTLYVGNLPSTADSAEIVQKHLEKMSHIPIKNIRKRRNYNYSFVEYDNHRQAQAALIALRNQSWSGCPLRVEVAASDATIPTTTTSTSTTMNNSPKNINIRFTDSLTQQNESRSRSKSIVKVSENRRDRDEKRRTLYVKNLDKSTRDIDFRSMFEAHGSLTRCLIIRDIPSRKLNYGFVQYETFAQANRAFYEVHGQRLNGVVLHIEFCKSLPGERKKRINDDYHHKYKRSRSRSRRWSHSRSPSHSRSYSRHSRFSRSRSRSPSRQRRKRRHRKSESPRYNYSRSRSRSRIATVLRKVRHFRDSVSIESLSKSMSVQLQRIPQKRKERSLDSMSDVSQSHSSKVEQEMEEERKSGSENDLVLHTSNRKKHRRHKMNTFPQLSLSAPLCVNLPKEYDMRYMRYLIAFDSREKRYVLFQANQTSSHLRKLQQTAIICTQAIISAQQSVNVSSAMNAMTMYNHQKLKRNKNKSGRSHMSHHSVSLSELSDHESKDVIVKDKENQCVIDDVSVMREPTKDFTVISVNENINDSESGIGIGEKKLINVNEDICV